MSISRSREQAFTTLRFFSAKLALVAFGALLGLPAESDEVEGRIFLRAGSEARMSWPAWNFSVGTKDRPSAPQAPAKRRLRPPGAT